MNWTAQSEEMLKNWTENQQKMWDSWMKMMTPATAQASMVELWQQSVEAWESAIKNATNTQGEWMKMWLASLEDMPNVPDDVLKMAEQAVEMNRQWSANQEKLWDGWFAAAKNVSPGSFMNSWEEESVKAMHAWQDSANQMMEANKKLAETWAVFGTTANGK
jgi:prophage DNA circulation protein